MTEAQLEVLNTLIASRDGVAKELEAQRRIISDSGWVVRCGGFYCRYEIGEKGAVLSVKSGGILGASKMSETNMRHLATETKNGAGEYGEAMHVIDALKHELANLNKIITDIETRLNK